MTHRRDLENQRHSLVEIREIMNSMKTLAFMETRKLARFIDAQHVVVQNIEDAVADLISFHPEILPEKKVTGEVFILIGTERGFCGDFNQALLRHLEADLQEHSTGSPMFIAVGRKLYTLLEGDPRAVAFIDGAGIVEEIASLLEQVVDELVDLQGEHGALTVYCLYHGSEEGATLQKLLPPFQALHHREPRFPYPPVLYQSPGELLTSFIDHYLFAVLHEILYTSLMVENHRRVVHLEGAIRHLDDKSAELSRKCNAMRQEEIIEEIEVILLSAATPDDKSGAGHNI